MKQPPERGVDNSTNESFMFVQLAFNSALCWAHLCGGNYVKISVKSVAGQTGNLV